MARKGKADAGKGKKGNGKIPVRNFKIKVKPQKGKQFQITAGANDTIDNVKAKIFTLRTESTDMVMEIV